MSTKNNIYINHGYKNRHDYFISLSERFDIDISGVYAIADIMGKNEDFDGLVSSLDDYNYMINGNAFFLN